MENSIILILSAFVISTACGFIIIPHIVNFCIKKNLYDIPNARKVHKNAIPRLGGICFLPCTLIAFIFGIAILNQLTGQRQITIGTWSVMFLISLSLIYIIGIVDDIVGVRPRTKFAVQIIAASLLPLSGLYINNMYGMFGIHELPFWVGAPLTVFVLVFIDNAMAAGIHVGEAELVVEFRAGRFFKRDLLEVFRHGFSLGWLRNQCRGEPLQIPE